MSDRHLSLLLLPKRFLFLPDQEQQKEWVVEDIEKDSLLLPVVFGISFFFRQNVAIGNFARGKGLSGFPLNKTELLWLFDENDQGSVRFARLHERQIRGICERFSEEALDRSWEYVQWFVAHQSAHWFYEGLAHGHIPTEDDLADLDVRKIPEDASDPEKSFWARMRLRRDMLRRLEDFEKIIRKEREKFHRWSALKEEGCHRLY